MRPKPRIAVVGAGFFGCHVALALESFAHVVLFERNPSIMGEASTNNQYRLHSGFHYPRDDVTAKQSLQGNPMFEDYHGSSIISFPSYYCIAENGSRVTADEYRDFIKRNGLNAVECQTPEGVSGVSMTVVTDERVIDCGSCHWRLEQALGNSLVDVVLNCPVTGIERNPLGFILKAGGGLHAFDYVIDCSYASYGKLTEALGHAPEPLEFRYTVLPIISLPKTPKSITIMDGEFWSLCPYGTTGLFILSHVTELNVAVTRSRNLAQSYAGTCDTTAVFRKIVEKVAPFYPNIRQAEHIGSLAAMKMILADQDATDARPTLWKSPEPGFVTVLAGKINHCVDVAYQIADHIHKEVYHGQEV